jgi:hypothetical protein
MEFKCNQCLNIYKSYQSRWNHIKRVHCSTLRDNSKGDSKDFGKDCGKDSKDRLHSNNKLFECRYCDKIYKHKQTRYSHELKCTNKEKESNEMIKLKNQVLEMSKTILDLQKVLKIHPKQLQKINNQLNNQNINNGNIFNSIVKLGNENLPEILNDKQKLSILNRQACSINQLVELIHIGGKFNQFKNVYITNLQSNFAYKYDDKVNKFIAVNKNDLLNDLIDCRIYDIQMFYEELESKMEDNKSKQVKKFLDRITEEPLFKNLKKEEIKLILYNNKESIKKTYEKYNNKEIEI